MSCCAQNCSKTGEGAFTGEVSATQLKDARVQRLGEIRAEI